MKNPKSFLLSALCFLLFITVAYGQNPNCYRITFSDKNDSPYSIDRPEEFLSPRALAKRERFNIPIIEQDLPVNPQYIDSILNFSSDPSQIIAFSKWNNSVVIFYPETENCHAIIDAMLNHFSFVIDTLPVAYYQVPIIPSFNPSPPLSLIPHSSSLISSCDYDYGNSIDNIKLHNGHLLHKAGFCGEDMLICVFDGGWDGFDTISYFKSLYENGQILGTRDLIPGINNVYIGHYHGTYVTSEMASMVEGHLIGTVPKANYYFIRSENVFPPGDEQLVEEDFWAYAAEIADSLGADVVNSSIGYWTFDFDWQNIYTYANNDGVSSVASRAASILAQKGVIVVQGAGNMANSWRYIVRPADAFHVLAVGMVSKTGIVVPNSAYGPSADGRIKPDVAALGVDVWGINSKGEIVNEGGGCSAAAPIIAGLSACLWQALPQYSSLEIMDLIRKYGDRYNNPDDRTGYGIPNFYQCYLDNANSVPEKVVPEIVVYPNPTNGELRVTSYELQVNSIEIFDIYGRKLSQIPNFTSIPSASGGDLSHYSLLTTHYSIDISHLPNGIYFVRIQTEKDNVTRKIVKTNKILL
ncbi:MAG: S8 family peptidase [Bacteroidales bacterium]|jgi:hypothetical protein|nr:S8 family peptidase [Bacteroidales bacterium]